MPNDVKPRGMLLKPLLTELLALKGHRLEIFEAGCLRDWTEHGAVNDGHSTLYIAQWIAENPGNHRFVSAEIVPTHITTCSDFLKEQGIKPPEFFHGPAEEHLASRREPVDFAFLDTADDPQVTMGQFQALEQVLRFPAMAVIDDVYDMIAIYGVDINKGRLAVPYAESKGWTVDKVDRMAVMRKGQT